MEGVHMIDRTTTIALMAAIMSAGSNVKVTDARVFVADAETLLKIAEANAAAEDKKKAEEIQQQLEIDHVYTYLNSDALSVPRDTVIKALEVTGKNTSKAAQLIRNNEVAASFSRIRLR
jgi:NACalpha-BTF3-like transcription factor